MTDTTTTLKNESVFRAKVFTFNKSDILRLPREFCQRYGIDESVTFTISATNGGFLFAPKRGN